MVRVEKKGTVKDSDDDDSQKFVPTLKTTHLYAHLNTTVFWLLCLNEINESSFLPSSSLCLSLLSDTQSRK